MLNTEMQAELIRQVKLLYPDHSSHYVPPNEKAKKAIHKILTQAKANQLDVSELIFDIPIIDWLIQAALQENIDPSQSLYNKKNSLLQFDALLDIAWHTTRPDGQTSFYALMWMMSRPNKLQENAWKILEEKHNSVKMNPENYKLFAINKILNTPEQVDFSVMPSYKPSLLSLFMMCCEKHPKLKNSPLAFEVLSRPNLPWNMIEEGFGSNGTPLLRAIKLFKKHHHLNSGNIYQKILPILVDDPSLNWQKISDSNDSPLYCLTRAAKYSFGLIPSLERLFQIHNITIWPEQIKMTNNINPRLKKLFDFWISLNQAKTLPLEQLPPHLENTAKLAESVFNEKYEKAYLLMVEFYQQKLEELRKLNAGEMLYYATQCQHFANLIPKNQEIYPRKQEMNPDMETVEGLALTFSLNMIREEQQKNSQFPQATSTRKRRLDKAMSIHRLKS